MIRKAPVALCACVVAGAVLGWLASNTYYQGVIAAQKARIDLLRDSRSGADSLKDDTRGLAADLRAFLEHWAQANLGATPEKEWGLEDEELRERVTMSRYDLQYEGRVRAIRDRLSARGLQDAELERLMDGTYKTTDAAKIPDRLDALAKRLPEPGLK